MVVTPVARGWSSLRSAAYFARLGIQSCRVPGQTWLGLPREVVGDRLVRSRPDTVEGECGRAAAAPGRELACGHSAAVGALWEPPRAIQDSTEAR
ncbi:hypothetical protein ABZU94_38895 [Streptomyces mirabilis]|uniref:hypothetical protein n=1 Tax=Streptomyces sp. NPDC005388 TaxID=3156717 RepID=UPI0033A23914